MGLHPGIHAADQYSVVFDPQLAGDSAVPQWDGRDDSLEDAA